MINIRLVLVCLFYFLGCYLWYEHSPFQDLHKWTYKMQAVYYILPLQVLFLFFFFYAKLMLLTNKIANSDFLKKNKSETRRTNRKRNKTRGEAYAGNYTK